MGLPVGGKYPSTDRFSCPKWFNLLSSASLRRLPSLVTQSSGAPMWEDSSYFWIVLCKNHWFHARKNFFFRHQILLAETDAFASRPPVNRPFKVRCDECGKEYVYKVTEVLRVEHEPPESFTHIRYFVMRPIHTPENLNLKKASRTSEAPCRSNGVVLPAISSESPPR